MRVAENFADLEGGVVQLELAGFDLGEVENVVDEREQRLGRILDDAQVLALHGRQLGSQQQLRHADDGVHRRADLVAHVRQEGALGAAGGFGRLHRLSLRVLHLFALRDVDGDSQDGRLAFVLDRRGGEVDPQGMAVFIDELDFVPRRDGLAALAGQASLLDQIAEVGMNVIEKAASPSARRACSPA